ncbi:MAG: hypothetical protein HGA39_05995 [Coriobacteriia bacterium]|nr:hypothetical protein [Coriobacteriia bacterium]
MDERRMTEQEAARDFPDEYARLSSRPENTDRVWAYQETEHRPGLVRIPRLALFATGSEGRVRITVDGNGFSVNNNTDDEPRD